MMAGDHTDFLIHKAGTLEESEQKFRALVEQSVTGIYIIIGDKMIYANPRCAEITGYPQDALNGMPVLDLIPETDHAEIAERMRRAYSGEEKTQRFDGRLKRRDGTIIDFGAHAAAIIYRGQPAIIGTLQDISERKRALDREKQYLTQIEQAMFGAVNAVSTMVDLRDPYTAIHEHRVGDLAAAIGTKLGLSDGEVQGLRVSGGLHDVGKISVPAEILTKPSRLTAAEYEIVKTHSQNGYEILKTVHFPWLVAQTVLQHHERLDGSGYPQRLKGDAITLPARILAIADTVDAMASHRPYRPARGVDEALQEIEQHSGIRYDPGAAAACLRLFREKNYRLEA